MKSSKSIAAILAAVEGTRATIVVENHLTVGGLGSAVAELLAQHGSDRRLIRLGVRDTYACGGSEAFLLARYQMDKDAILKAAGALLDLDPSLASGGEGLPEISVDPAKPTSERQAFAII